MYEITASHELQTKVLRSMKLKHANILWRHWPAKPQSRVHGSLCQGTASAPLPRTKACPIPIGTAHLVPVQTSHGASLVYVVRHPTLPHGRGIAEALDAELNRPPPTRAAGARDPRPVPLRPAQRWGRRRPHRLAPFGEAHNSAFVLLVHNEFVVVWAGLLKSSGSGWTRRREASPPSLPRPVVRVRLQLEQPPRDDRLHPVARLPARGYSVHRPRPGRDDPADECRARRAVPPVGRRTRLAARTSARCVAGRRIPRPAAARASGRVSTTGQPEPPGVLLLIPDVDRPRRGLS